MKRPETRGERAVRIAELHIIHTATIYSKVRPPRSMELIEEWIQKLDRDVAALRAARRALGLEKRAATRAKRRP